MEYGDIAKGYKDEEIFQDYAMRSFQRSIEIADMIFNDGIQTLFLVGIMPGQTQRDTTYQLNLAKSLRILADENAWDLYANHDIGVMFRGNWEYLLNQLDVPDILDSYLTIEEHTAPYRSRLLIWTTAEETIPSPLAPLIAESIHQTGQLPPTSLLVETYYSRALSHIDIFIGHNKPSLKSQIPPLLEANDLYFTMTPSYYLDLPQWRHILYDHLFARRGNKRDYDTWTQASVNDLRTFYANHRRSILGVGNYQPLTQTWRPETE